MKTAYYKLSQSEKIDTLEAIIFDLIEGRDKHDIKGLTGLSLARCEEIENLADQIIVNYSKRHGI